MQRLLVISSLSLLGRCAGTTEGSPRASFVRKHSPWPWKKQSHHKIPVLPQDGRVAIILRGQSFRSRHVRTKKKFYRAIFTSCVDSRPVVEAQLSATTSLLSNIVAPLEKAGNSVDFVVTDGPCRLRGKLLEAIRGGGSRTVVEAEYASPSQVEDIRFTLETFKNSSRGSSAQYNLILVTRHDIIWKKRIDAWEGTDFSNFNFLSRCEERAKLWAKGICTNDIFHMMPGWLFNAFDSQVGKGNCFSFRERYGYEHRDGHECYQQVVDAVGRAHGHVGFVMDWVPKLTIEESNSLYSFVTDG